jgi:co-chaperonin GroES (HSP10)
MIYLPKNAVTILPDAPEEKVTASGIIMAGQEDPEPTEGVIMFTCEELKEFQGDKVKFRPEFAEEIEIKGQRLVFLRDFNSSIYYVIKD